MDDRGVPPFQEISILVSNCWQKQVYFHTKLYNLFSHLEKYIVPAEKNQVFGKASKMCRESNSLAGKLLVPGSHHVEGPRHGRSVGTFPHTCSVGQRQNGGTIRCCHFFSKILMLRKSPNNGWHRRSNSSFTRFRTRWCPPSCKLGQLIPRTSSLYISHKPVREIGVMFTNLAIPNCGTL